MSSPIATDDRRTSRRGRNIWRALPVVLVCLACGACNTQAQYDKSFKEAYDRAFRENYPVAFEKASDKAYAATIRTVYADTSDRLVKEGHFSFAPWWLFGCCVFGCAAGYAGQFLILGTLRRRHVLCGDLEAILFPEVARIDVEAFRRAMREHGGHTGDRANERRSA